MSINIIHKENCLTSRWSGGATTELYIYPPDSSYRERNFDLRISTASVEAATSTFTKLPGIRRHLIILEGEIRLYPENQEQRKMGKGDKIFFPGDWEMRSAGNCIDFNVMTSKKIETAIDTMIIQENTCRELLLTPSWRSVFLYCSGGKFNLHLEKDLIPVSVGMLLCITGRDLEQCMLCAETTTELIIVSADTDFR